MHSDCKASSLKLRLVTFQKFATITSEEYIDMTYYKKAKKKKTFYLCELTVIK